jgi:hypothetical protein
MGEACSMHREMEMKMNPQFCYKNLIGESTFRRQRLTWKNNIKIDSNVTWRKVVDYIVLAQDRVEWCAFVIVMMDLQMNMWMNR